MAKRNASRSRIAVLARMLLALTLALSLAPSVPAFAAENDGDASQTAANGSDAASEAIAEMLATGNYVEGEALAIVRVDEQPDTTAQVEQLAEVDKDSVGLAVEAADQTEDAVDDMAALRVQDAPADSYDVKLVVDHSRTTEQILRELYDDPNVIVAEPNYSYEAAEALEGYGDESSAASALTTSSSTQLTAQGTQVDPYSLTDTGDLTGLQWAYGVGMNTADNTSTPAASGNGYTLNVPGWTEGRTNANAEPNASGTVCIMDMGLDPKHPDLKDVLYEFSVEQQKEYGCGPYGYNASGDDYPVYTMRPSGEHGMHVAGIAASAWNGQGTSGIAHGIKIFGVNVFGGDGQIMVMSSVVEGFQFLVKAAKDVNLKAVNCSWGTKQTSFALGTMVNELGKQGVNTVIATGNDHENLDDRMELASQATNSPYAIRVNAAGPDGKPTMFTSYGQTASDVFAPGQAILSTYPVEKSMGSGKNLSLLSRHLFFFPAGAGAEDLLAYEKFESASGVKFYNENPALDASATEIAPATENVGYGDQRSVSFNVKSLKTEDYRKTGERQYDTQGLVGKNGHFHMAIPVDAAKVADAKWVSAALAVNDSFRPSGGIAVLTYKKADGDAAVEIDTASSNVLKRGWGASASTSMYQVQ